jgi:hypothetical protein
LCRKPATCSRAESVLGQTVGESEIYQTIFEEIAARADIPARIWVDGAWVPEDKVEALGEALTRCNVKWSFEEKGEVVTFVGAVWNHKSKTKTLSERTRAKLRTAMHALKQPCKWRTGGNLR